MKKLFLAAAISFLTASVFAQSFGIRAGVNIANVNIKSQGLSIKPDAKIGVNAGIFVNFPVVPAVSIQPELAYSGMGYKADISGVSGTETYSYLTLPVLVKVKIPTTGLHFYAGPQAGLLLSAKGESDGETEDTKEHYKSTDIAGVVGAEYNLPFGLLMSARYQFGLTNILKDGQGVDGTVKNNCVSLMVGFKF